MNKTILTLTMNPALDVFFEVPRVEPDRKLRSSRPTYQPGGGGINVSRAIGRLHGTSTALFPSGGAAGDLLATLLHRESIATSTIPIAELTRENVNVTESSTGREYRFIIPGPELGIEEWQACLHAVESFRPRPDYVVVSGSLPPGVPADFHARLARMAIENNFRLVVDTSGEPLRHAATRGTFILKPNLRELAAMTGIPSISREGVDAAARLLVERGVETVVVSASAAGAILVDRGHVLHVAAPVVPPVSRIGAGDSMVAGIVLALAQGSDIDDAVRYGVAAGTAAIMSAGHRLCTHDDTERLFAEMAPVAVTV